MGNNNDSQLPGKQHKKCGMDFSTDNDDGTGGGGGGGGNEDHDFY